jgi:hypothetical protein
LLFVTLFCSDHLMYFERLSVCFTLVSHR